VAALSSCVKGSEESATSTTVHFTGGICGQTATRAAGTTWSAGDLIGIFMVEKGTTSVYGNAANRQYTTTSGAGTFTPASDNEAIEFPVVSTTEVDFVAYYPWTNAMTLTAPMTVLVNPVQTTTNQPGYDILWASANNSGNGYTNAHVGAVALNFTHRLSKIVLDVTADEKVGSLTGMTVRAKGLHISGMMDLATGIVVVSTPPSATDITMRAVTDGEIYDAIIIPATYTAGAATLEFTVDDETYSCDLPTMTYAPANEYVYSVNIEPTGVTITGTIQPWITNDAGKLTAR
jgi:hypothetical protein